MREIQIVAHTLQEITGRNVTARMVTMMEVCFYDCQQFSQKSSQMNAESLRIDY